MEARTHRATLGWLLVCALAFSVAAMHHVGAPPAAVHATGTAETAHDHPDHSAPSEECGHDQRGTCEAVLSGSAIAQQAPPAVLVDSPAVRPSAGEACPAIPARSGRLLLTSVCVFRL